MSLNKLKPFGEVHGLCAYKFMQDGKFFNGQGEEVTEKGLTVHVTDPRAESITKHNEEKVDPRAKVIEAAEKMTVPALKVELKRREIEFDKNAVKPDLVTMLVDDELAH